MDGTITSPETRNITRPPLVRGPIRYRNHFRWRIMPPEGASEQGFFDRSFETRRKPSSIKSRLKPSSPMLRVLWSILGRWMDSLGRIIR